MLERGAYVNIQNIQGFTALMYASQNGHTEIVISLLERGAEVKMTNFEGETALMLASQYGHTDVVNLLLNKTYAKEVDIKDKDDQTALMKASQYGTDEYGPDDKLILFAKTKNKRIIENLIKKGASVRILNKNNENVLNCAVKNEVMTNNNLLMTEFLLNKIIEKEKEKEKEIIDNIDIDGNSVLMNAINYKKYDIDTSSL